MVALLEVGEVNDLFATMQKMTAGLMETCGFIF